jgi:hypothetical protein
MYRFTLYIFGLLNFQNLTSILLSISKLSTSNFSKVSYIIINFYYWKSLILNFLASCIMELLGGCIRIIRIHTLTWLRGRVRKVRGWWRYWEWWGRWWVIQRNRIYFAHFHVKEVVLNVVFSNCWLRRFSFLSWDAAI